MMYSSLKRTIGERKPVLIRTCILFTRLWAKTTTYFHIHTSRPMFRTTMETTNNPIVHTTLDRPSRRMIRIWNMIGTSLLVWIPPRLVRVRFLYVKSMQLNSRHHRHVIFATGIIHRTVSLIQHITSTKSNNTGKKSDE